MSIGRKLHVHNGQESDHPRWSSQFWGQRPGAGASVGGRGLAGQLPRVLLRGEPRWWGTFLFLSHAMLVTTANFLPLNITPMAGGCAGCCGHRSQSLLADPEGFNEQD